MAFITLSGTLLDPNGDLAVGDQIRFTHKSTTGETVESAVSLITISPTGTYSLPLQYGLVLVEYKDVRTQQFKNLGVATVNGANPATSIPELLNALVPVSSAELIEFQAILADCVTAQNAAAASAAAALVSENAAAASAATIDLINDLSQAYIFETVANYQASTIVFPDGKTIHLNDRDANFTVVAGVAGADDTRIIANTANSQSISINENFNIISPSMLGLANQEEVRNYFDSLGEQGYVFDNFGRTQLINSADEESGVLDVSNFAGQALGNVPLGVLFHHYTDGRLCQMDNVGSGTILTLKNAQNSTRRPDKAANYVGDGSYLSLQVYDNTSMQSEQLFFINNLSNFVWTGAENTGKLLQAKADDGFWAFESRAIAPHANLYNFRNNFNTVLEIKNDVGFTRALLESGANQTNGLEIKSNAGSLVLGSASGTVKFKNTVKAEAGNLILQGANTGDVVHNASPVSLPIYTTVNLPVLDSSVRALAWDSTAGQMVTWTGATWV
jgi:hypothetical protein